MLTNGCLRPEADIRLRPDTCILNVRFIQERDFFIQVEPVGIESVTGVVADTNLVL